MNMINQIDLDIGKPYIYPAWKRPSEMWSSG